MNYTSYYNYQKYETRNGTSVPCYPATYSIDGDGTKPLVKKQDNDPNCGYIPPVEPTYRWVNLSIYTDYVCDNGNKFYKQQKQVSYDNGITWSYVSPAEYRKGDLYESGSTDCALKFRALYNDGSPTYEAACDGNTSLTTATTRPSGYEYSAMTSAEVGQCITSIGREAFEGCRSLSSITMQDSVTSIGGYAFNHCTSLTSIDIPSGVTSIGGTAFQFCWSLTSIEIPSGVTSISSSIFGNCYSLTSVTIPNSVTTIGSGAFHDCRSLTSIDIPNTVTSIGQAAFDSCGLTSINIPSGVTSIGDSALHGCSSLTSVTVNSNNTVYDSRNNCNAIIKTETNTLVQGCKTTIIPNTVTSIGNTAFNGCINLTSVTIPDSVTSIGNTAFNGCINLTSINIPSGVTSIGYDAFRNCYSLTSIDIPSGVTSIGHGAFQNCSGLTSITVNAATPPTLSNSNAFSDTNNCPIYVPAQSVQAYKTASGWSDYASRIRAIQ